MSAAGAIREALDGMARLAEGARGLGWAGALALGAAGLWLLLDGAHRRRPIAAVVGGVAGALVSAVLGTWARARFGVSPAALTAAAALALGAAAAAFPPLCAFAVGALPGALLGSLLPLGGSELAGALVGALVGGVVATLQAAPVAAAAAASLGAALLAGAALSALGARPAGAELAERPFVVLGLVGVVAVAGANFQARRAWRSGPGLSPGQEDLDATRIA
ncbi:MAG TPA: hypothetical protein VLS93_12420 [Anaeromyxobacteraceae bacterium]|nr:hypothetical protein [Anaeromyxobacteraceae bacterium]